MTEAPRFTWSHSSIQDYMNCPLSYAHKRYYKDVEEDQSVEHLVWGNRVHKALELALNEGITPEALELERRLGGSPPPWLGGVPDHEIVPPFLPYIEAILEKARLPGAILLTEFQMCITEDMKPTGWYDADAWGRGIIDVCVIVGDTAWIFDWKTGKVKFDEAQLKLFAAFLSLHYPQVKRFIPRFIWLKFGKVTPKDYVIPLEQVPKIWADVLQTVRRMRTAWDQQIFPAKPSGLCPWCAYKECLFKKR